jgi:hypothetical protein
LAFHPYPQVIPQVFNPGGFGPPRRLTGASTCPWIDHSASGLDHATPGALFGLAFATASPHGLTSPHNTNSQAHSSKGTPSQSQKQPLRRIVCTWFQVLFHSPPGVLFTFPSRYLSAIGHQGVFRLNGWSRQIHTEFQGFRVTWGNAPEPPAYVYGGITLYAQAFQPASTSLMVSHSAPARQYRSNGPTTPKAQPLPGITRLSVWPPPLSLATTHGITIVFSSCGY